jgi:hypothetical protein
MKSRPSALTLGLMLVVGFAALSLSQTNKHPALILPPADWDAGKHPLASLVATNKPGDYSLPCAWAGMERATARIGSYAAKDEIRREKDEWVEFDTFTVTPGASFPAMRRSIFKGERQYGPIYRPSLPSDAELLAMRSLSSVSNFLGRNPFPEKSKEPKKLTNSGVVPVEGETTIIPCYFTLRPYNSIEIVRVAFRKRPGESTMDGILVRRARLHPQPKRQ